MNILMLTGSPHKHGTTDFLAEHYIAGAIEAGHTVTRFDTANMRIHPCIGCNTCDRGGGCIFSDSMDDIIEHLHKAGRLVLVTPLYCFGMTVQLKSAVDRLYIVRDRLRQKPRELELLAAGADRDEWAGEALVSHIDTMARYLGWQCRSPIVALGCATRKDAEAAGFAQAARAQGRS